jgi:hypothetical protein
LGNNYFEELVNYYKNQANILEAKSSAASIYDNKTDKGRSREDHLFDFLEAHIPTRCNIIKGGFVFDSLGNKSKQIDIMICNDQTFQFRQSLEDNKTTSFNCVEGCYAVISVKSYLNKNELIDSLDNLASVSTYKKLKPNFQISNWDQVIEQIPQRIIFAYDGDSLETINHHCLDYYTSVGRPKESSIDFIMVNNNFYISKAGILGVKDMGTGEIIPHGQYSRIDKTMSKCVGAICLTQLI